MIKPSLVLLLTLTLAGNLPAQSTAAGPRVVPVYMIPGDMSLSRERLSLTVKAIESVRQWYGRVLGGRTFSYDPVVVQVSRHSFAEFAADSFQAWWPLLQTEFQAYGQDWEDDDTKMLWIAHGAGAWAGADSENGGIDSIQEAGQVTDGDLGGLAVIGDSSLGGYLAGVCPDSGRTGSAWWCSWYTFMGTVAHELGHTWGLPHPDAFLPGFRCADSTAWTNMQCHWGFPFDSLLTFEQTHLRSLRHFRYPSDASQYILLSGRPDLEGTVERANFAQGDSLLWIEGRGGGTGYLTGLLARHVSFRGIQGWLVTDLGLPRGSAGEVSVSILVGSVERYNRTLRPGDPPLPVAIPINFDQRVTIRANGKVAMGNARLIPRRVRE
jgi:hypothetical protein